MTVTNENAFIEYRADGITTFFEYGFDLTYDFLVEVRLDGGPPPAFTQQATGVLFASPPPAGSLVLLRRLSFVIQPLNWRPFGPFEAEKTESGLDRLILLKQEADQFRAKMNLLAVHRLLDIDLQNNQGTGVVLEMWGNGRAGVYAATLTDAAPSVGFESDRPDGYIYWQWDNQSAAPPGAQNELTSTLYPLEFFEAIAGAAAPASAGLSEYGVVISGQATVADARLIVTIAYPEIDPPVEVLEGNATVAGARLITTIAYPEIEAGPETIAAAATVADARMIVIIQYIPLDSAETISAQATVAGARLFTA